MARENLMRDVRTCLDHGIPDKLPVFLAVTTPFELQLFGMTHDEYATSADNIVQTTSRAIHSFDYDYYTLHVDSCLVLEPLGIKVGPKGTNRREPWVPLSHIPNSWDAVNNLHIPSPDKDGRMPVVLEAIRRIKDEFQDTVCLSGHVTAPFSTFTYLFGTTEAMLLLYEDPELAKCAIEFSMQLQLAFAKAQIFAGADAIWIGDLNSSSHLISLRHHKEFAYEPTKMLIEEINRYGGLCFYHQNEPKLEYIKLTAEYIQKGMGGINIGQGADIFQVHEEIGDRVCVLGGFDPWDVLQKKPEELDVMTKELIGRISKGGGHIICSGGQIAIETPEINVRTILRAAREYWSS